MGYYGLNAVALDIRCLPVLVQCIKQTHQRSENQKKGFQVLENDPTRNGDFLKILS